MNSTEIALRKTKRNRQAIIMVHGFGGSPQQTFGLMPAFIAGDLGLSEWDIHLFGYPTHLAPDITGVWSSDPDLEMLAGHFADRMKIGYGHYEKLTLVAHSMGGLIVQKALLTVNLAKTVAHVVLFGTPSGGLKNATLGKIFKRQVRDMTPSSHFIRNLRSGWNQRFSSPPFQFHVVAGLSDQFVPPDSSLSPFAEAHHFRVRGNHVEMVKPLQASDDCIEFLCARLKGQAAPTLAASIDPASTPASGPLDPEQIVAKALALELRGATTQAIQLLEENQDLNYYVTGALAGRYKRIWMAAPDDQHPAGDKALSVYTSAFEKAKLEDKPKQAAYNGINRAFMLLALKNDPAASEATAQTVLELTNKATTGSHWKWRTPTRAEALLHLRQYHKAVSAYRTAGELLDLRERGSMYQQAIWTARLLGENYLEQELESILRPTTELS